MNKVTINLLTTGVPGLDQVLGGGLPEFSFNLIMGPPGSGNIVQRYIEVESRLKRVMAVVKVRASAHSTEIRQFGISDDGIVIGDPVLDCEGLLGGRPKRTPDPDTGDRGKS